MRSKTLARGAATLLFMCLLGAVSVSSAAAETDGYITFIKTWPDPDGTASYDYSKIVGVDNRYGYQAGYAKMESYRGGSAVRYLTVCDTRTDGRVVFVVIYPTNDSEITYPNRCGRPYALGYKMLNYQLYIGTSSSFPVDPPTLM